MAHAIFLIHANLAKILTHATHFKILWTHATHATISTNATHETHAKSLWTHANPRHPRQILTYVATHEPTPPTPLPMLFSRLITIIDQQLYYAIMWKTLNGMSLISFIVGQEILINMTTLRKKF